MQPPKHISDRCLTIHAISYLKSGMYTDSSAQSAHPAGPLAKRRCLWGTRRLAACRQHGQRPDILEHCRNIYPLWNPGRFFYEFNQTYRRQADAACRQASPHSKTDPWEDVKKNEFKVSDDKQD
ncbi:hypothetical protein N2384_08830 [Bacillus paralicheniformis]|nr:hypothetical protein [Bacillus paralicheniformis]UWS62936.1 hypothetical protein N2384_08830 [Bacillus paralicheniformis]